MVHDRGQMSALCHGIDRNLRRPRYVPALRKLSGADRLDAAETFYPLHVRICPSCLLVQLPAYVPGEDIFSDYAYFSSYSDSWVAHARRYAQAMSGGARPGAGQPGDRGGQQRRLPAATLRRTRASRCSGIEPAANVAEVARQPGASAPRCGSWGPETAPSWPTGTAGPTSWWPTTCTPTCRTWSASPRGWPRWSSRTGLVTLEFPHLLRLIERRQYDTIYHEHYQYLTLLPRSARWPPPAWSSWTWRSCSTPRRLAAGACPPPAPRRAAVETVGQRTSASRCWTPRPSRPAHRGGSPRLRRRGVRQSSGTWSSSCSSARAQGRRVVGYGAPGKGNTLLNHCGIRSDLLEYTVDRSPHKQGRFLPGTHIPIHPPERIAADRPDYVLVLPWNLRTEISRPARLRPRLGRPAGRSRSRSPGRGSSRSRVS